MVCIVSAFSICFISTAFFLAFWRGGFNAIHRGGEKIYGERESNQNEHCSLSHPVVCHGASRVKEQSGCRHVVFQQFGCGAKDRAGWGQGGAMPWNSCFIYGFPTVWGRSQGWSQMQPRWSHSMEPFIKVGAPSRCI